MASAIWFSPFGRIRAVQRRIWRQLVHAARSAAVVSAVQRELDRFLARLARPAFAHPLPHAVVDLHRLVVVPRRFVNGEANRSLDETLQAEQAFATIDESLRGFFAAAVIKQIDDAIAQAQPSPRHPLPAGSDWITVGVNATFEWCAPLDGPAWPGHYYVLELTRAPITRAVKKAAADAIAQMEASLPSLTRIDRSEILRRAWLSLQPSVARA